MLAYFALVLVSESALFSTFFLPASVAETLSFEPLFVKVTPLTLGRVNCDIELSMLIVVSQRQVDLLYLSA